MLLLLSSSIYLSGELISCLIERRVSGPNEIIVRL